MHRRSSNLSLLSRSVTEPFAPSAMSENAVSMTFETERFWDMICQSKRRRYA